MQVQIEHLKQLKNVVLHTVDGRTLQATHNGTFWELLPADLGLDEAIRVILFHHNLHTLYTLTFQMTYRAGAIMLHRNPSHHISSIAGLDCPEGACGFLVCAVQCTHTEDGCHCKALWRQGAAHSDEGAA